MLKSCTYSKSTAYMCLINPEDDDDYGHKM